MKTAFTLATAFALSACQLPMGDFEMQHTGAATTLSLPVMVSGSCGAAGLQTLLNQPESALGSVALPANTRIIRPGMDFARDTDPARLNIGISGAGQIVHVACG